jgi:hypothetical protein
MTIFDPNLAIACSHICSQLIEHIRLIIMIDAGDIVWRMLGLVSGYAFFLIQRYYDFNVDF